MTTSDDTIRFGIHYMLDGYGADLGVLADEAQLTALLQTLPADLGMHTLCEPVVVEVGPLNKKDPGGFSGFVLISESHISFHTFPKRGFITLDIYTCQDELDTGKLRDYFVDFFALTDYEEHVVNRGTRYPVSNLEED